MHYLSEGGQALEEPKYTECTHEAERRHARQSRGDHRDDRYGHHLKIVSTFTGMRVPGIEGRGLRRRWEAMGHHKRIKLVAITTPELSQPKLFMYWAVLYFVRMWFEICLVPGHHKRIELVPTTTPEFSQPVRIHIHGQF